MCCPTVESLYAAAGRGDTHEVSEMLAAGVSPQSVYENGWTALHHAAKQGHLCVVQLLVTQGAEVDARTLSSYLPGGTGDTPLHWAAQEGHVETVEYLLSSGADPNMRNERGLTPLHLAAMNCPPRKPLERMAQIVQSLLQNGADINTKSRNGLTPLARAEHGGELARLLRAQGGKYSGELGVRGFVSRLLGRV